MGPIGGGGSVDINFLNSRIVDKVSAGGSTALAEQNSTLNFQNGASDYNYTVSRESTVAFPRGGWQKLTKEGAGDITVKKQVPAVAFYGPLGDVDFKLDGEAGYFAWIEYQGSDVWKYGGSVKAV
jgi:hypothetical protein